MKTGLGVKEHTVASVAMCQRSNYSSIALSLSGAGSFTVQSGDKTVLGTVGTLIGRCTEPTIRGQTDVDIAGVLFLHRISNLRGNVKKCVRSSQVREA